MKTLPSRWMKRKPAEARTRHEAFTQKCHEIKEELKSRGREIIDLRWGEGDAAVHGFVNRASSGYLIEAARKSLHMYPKFTPWYERCRNAVAEFERRYRNVNYSPDDIVLLPGVAACWFICHFALLDAGDEMIALEPSHYCWAPASHFHLFQAKIEVCPCRESAGWEPDLEDLRRKITDRTTGIVLVHPNNPTGAIYDEKALKGIIDIAGEHDIPIFSDEIYGLITYEGVEAKSIAEISKDVPSVVMSGMSKFLMSPGWRFGYIAFHDPLGRMTQFRETVKKAAAMYGQGTSCLTTPILYAAAKAFESPNVLRPVRNMTKKLQKHRDYILDRLDKMGGATYIKPRGTLFTLIGINGIGKTWRTEEDFLLHLLQEEALDYGAPGNVFGPSGTRHIRIDMLPNHDSLREAYNRLERFVDRHSKQVMT